MITDNKLDTYIPLYKNDILVSEFLEDTVLNSNGTDLTIYTSGYSDNYANIYISTDNNYYTLLGKINGSQNIHIHNFDLQDINYYEPVVYIKLIIYGDDNTPININAIKGYHNNDYRPLYGYYINIPTTKRVTFINDCDYYFPCSLYCDYNLINDDDYYSCVNGCNHFTKYKSCECNSDFVELYNTKIPNNYCNFGCNHNLQKFIYPEFSLKSYKIGNNIDLIYNHSDFNTSFLIDIISLCHKNNQCNSISINNDNRYGLLYNSNITTYSNDFYSIIKNDFIKLPTETTTTTSLSTSATSLSTTTTSLSTTTTSLSTTTTSLTATSLTTTATSLTTTATSLTNTATSLSSTTRLTATSLSNTSSIINNTNNTNNKSNTIQYNNSTKNYKSDKNDNNDRAIKIYIIIVSLLSTIIIMSIVIYFRLKYKSSKRTVLNNPVYDISYNNILYNPDDVNNQ